MTKMARATALLFVLMCPTLPAAAQDGQEPVLQAQPAPPTPPTPALVPPVQPAPQVKSQIKTSYEPPANAKFRPIYERLRQRHVLEELQAFMLPLRLPRELTVRTAQCGANTIPYKPQGPATICYELVDAIEQIVAKNNSAGPDQAQQVIIGGFIMALLHETAHAIFDVLDVPIWGREDDAADRLAALIMMQFGDDVALSVMFGTRQLFRWSDQKWTGSDFSSTASPDYQRYFNYACISIGANPLQFMYLVDDGLMPKKRAGPNGAWCRGEYDKIKKAFDLRIMPFVDPDLLVKARSTPWLAWDVNK